MMHSLDVNKPDVSENVAIDLVKRLYGLNVKAVKPMVSFCGDNFHITVAKEHNNPYIQDITDDGYTLKIMNTAKSSSEVFKRCFDAMMDAQIHLGKKGLKVPVPVLNFEGGLSKKVHLAYSKEKERNNEPCAVYLLTFIRGVTVGSIKYNKDVLYQWGRLLAEFHIAMEDINFHPQEEKGLLWSLRHVPDIRKFMDHIDDTKTQLVLSVLDRYSEEVADIENIPKGYIHGDFNESNILVQLEKKGSCESDAKYRVSGILDFEDIMYATYVWDVGVMLAYALLYCTTMDPLEGAGHALAGYKSLRSMENNELTMLKFCIESRLCQSLVLCSYRHKLEPHNQYLLSSAKYGWERLEQICGTTNEALLSMWNDIEKNIKSD